MIWLVATAAATLVVALALSRSRHDARALSWRALVNHDMRAALQDLEERCRLEDAMLIADFAAAKGMRLDRRAHAERILRAIVIFAEGAQDERLERLRAVRVLAKMTAASMVAPTLSPASFRLPELWATASLGAIAHAFLVSPAERLVLRLYVVTIGLRIALRVMSRAAERPAWGRFERALADWCALDQAHVLATVEASATMAEESVAMAPGGR